MEGLDKGLLHPNQRPRDWHARYRAGNRTRASAVGGEHSSKDLFELEQRDNSYSEHLHVHMSPKQFLLLYVTVFGTGIKTWGCFENCILLFRVRTGPSTGPPTFTSQKVICTYFSFSLHKNEFYNWSKECWSGFRFTFYFTLLFIYFVRYFLFIFTMISALPDKSFKELAASDVAKYLKSLVEVNMSFIPYESQVANPWWWWWQNYAVLRQRFLVMSILNRASTLAGSAVDPEPDPVWSESFSRIRIRKTSFRIRAAPDPKWK